MAKNPARRITLDKRERARALALSTAAAEARNAITDYVNERLKARGVDVENEGWNYDPLTGLAQRVR